MTQPIPVIDLFAGPGGLSEGFSALRTRSGGPAFSVRLSIEKDAYAHSTLELRSFFHQFSTTGAPREYYEFARGDLLRSELFGSFGEQAKRAKATAWHLELGATNEREVSQRIRNVLRGSDPWVLIGGPPCQAYSVVGRVRRKNILSYVPEEDGRQTLYREYLKVIADHWPAVFVMENVKGLGSAKLNGRGIFERIIEDLAAPATALRRRRRHSSSPQYRYHVYSLADHGKLLSLDPTDFVIEAERYGIPQSRHRIILFGIREDYRGDPPDTLAVSRPTPVSKVLDGLPRVRSGLTGKEDSASAWVAEVSAIRTQAWLRKLKGGCDKRLQELIEGTASDLKAPKRGRGGSYVQGTLTADFKPDWYLDTNLKGACNHETKAHMASDLHRYLYAACYAEIYGRSPRLRDFPDELMPAHANAAAAALLPTGMFADRFRVQVRHSPATTITSHIHKDGHYYIHYDPSQCRSLTVREAARIQTFPDNYIFCGPRTEQFIQVGNAVPPLLARDIASICLRILS